MHFRQRSKAIQVIRTTYDSQTKRAKNQILGSILKGNPQVSEQLNAACSPAELKEVNAWLEQYRGFELLKNEYAAKSLPEQIALAAAWFEQQPQDDNARLLATSVFFEWAALRNIFKKQQLLD